MTPPAALPARLRALRDYVQHKDNCPCASGQLIGTLSDSGDEQVYSWPCTCGLDALLAASPPEQADGPQPFEAACGCYLRNLNDDDNDCWDQFWCATHRGKWSRRWTRLPPPPVGEGG